ncbi:hypothetical protein CLV58_109233 [Spirosoma oryzae]|uniref:Uncharacterized protein n=1 Tax=Spirosoma oryzae TaxID=1469603 RepID=A0A2T0SYL8_9BACT|nr:hypothetical protein [Spirosoma oryzae]PRY38506.1 hypothetical protein CLV58_109233 [Spirosoma oryzae]
MANRTVYLNPVTGELTRTEESSNELIPINLPDWASNTELTYRQDRHLWVIRSEGVRWGDDHGHLDRIEQTRPVPEHLWIRAQAHWVKRRLGNQPIPYEVFNGSLGLLTYNYVHKR